jgi:hypothetical protein
LLKIIEPTFFRSNRRATRNRMVFLMMVFVEYFPRQVRADNLVAGQPPWHGIRLAISSDEKSHRNQSIITR